MYNQNYNQEYNLEPSNSTDLQLPRGSSISPLLFSGAEEEDEQDEMDLFLFTSANALQISRYRGAYNDVDTLLYHEFLDNRRIVASSVNMLGMSHSYEIYDFEPFTTKEKNQNVLECKYRFEWNDQEIENGASKKLDTSKNASVSNLDLNLLQDLSPLRANESKVLLLSSSKLLLHDYQSISAPTVLYQKKRNLTCFDHRKDSTNAIALGVMKNIVEVDLRQSSGETAIQIKDAHDGGVRDVNYNPLRRYGIISAGDDNLIRYWDTRKTDQALNVISGHSHWINRVVFNSYHPTLVLSASSDSSMNLYSLPTAMKSLGKVLDNGADDYATEQFDLEEESSLTTDKLVCKITEHDDSIVDVCWSSQSPWIFASISYDGKCMIHRVPNQLKEELILNS